MYTDSHKINLEQRIKRLDQLISVNNAIVNNQNSYGYKFLQSQLSQNLNDKNTIHYQYHYMKPKKGELYQTLATPVQIPHISPINNIYDLVQRTIEKQLEFEDQLKQLKRQINNTKSPQKQSYLRYDNEKNINNTKQIQSPAKLLRSIQKTHPNKNPSQLINQNISVIGTTAPVISINKFAFDQAVPLSTNRTKNNKVKRKKPKHNSYYKEKKDYDTKKFISFLEKEKQEQDSKYLVQNYERAKSQFQNSLAKLIKKQKQRKQSIPKIYNVSLKKNQSLKKFRQYSKDPYVQKSGEFVNEYFKNSARVKGKNVSTINIQIEEKTKSLIAEKIQKRLKQSQQNYKDSVHKNNKHEHVHLMNTFDFQRKLRDEIIRKTYELQDTKRFK